MDSHLTHLQARIEHYLKEIIRFLPNEHTLQLAKECVPLANIVQDNLQILDQEGDFNENLLPYLLDWFSNDFFNWFSPPNCSQCDKKLEFSHSFTNIEGLMVENYKCVDDSRCKQSNYEFIRHNDPAILLNTKQGRCGEWAMCFLVILKALDYHARIVLDTTDHVWNEVWLESKQKWIHVDPCESVIDMPLMYEIGWKKRLEYCIGMSDLEVIDVTARYTKNFDETLKYRPYCNLDQFNNYLNRLSSTLLEKIRNEDLKLLISKRRNMDLMFLNDISKKPQPVDNLANIGGRKTGSIQWRIERGEYNPIIDKRFVIKVKANQNISNIFSLKYNCDKNRYDSSQEELGLKTWSSLIYYSKNIDFKYERDWKCSYLARYETCCSSESGKIQWRFDISDIKSNWKSMKVVFKGKIYPNTTINIRLLSYDEDLKELKRLSIELNRINLISVDDLLIDKCYYVDIEAELTGGDSNDHVAWQKPQLFRQTRSIESHLEYPLEIDLF